MAGTSERRSRTVGKEGTEVSQQGHNDNVGGVRMPKHTVSCSAKCPYYKAHAGQEIYCRGLVPDTAIHIGFTTAADKKSWMDRYCKSIRASKDCKIRRMLEGAGL